MREGRPSTDERRPCRLSGALARVEFVDAPLALYRRYRPETFTEVIGQDHVAGPLRQALAHNRVHHAYLFSGPRGCGKTTSARILARTLNCEKAPVADPCGACQSCEDLARGGPGSIDVIEIDAASHGRVDDTRDLREKAFFSPVSSRYKVYIVDEAHMVSKEGFNALLKLVEEPPPHLKFVFATTEPDRVLATIRSRTHHYPFRLVPPRALADYLAQLCRREHVTIQPTALPLVVRAGNGSVRDALSVLDQLIGGADEGGVTYDLAVGLLGYTPDSLLDEVVDAFSAGDGGSVFAAVDKVIDSGQEPRRFAADLLQRLRDLIVVSAVPGAAGKGLLEVAEDKAERLEGQAARFGAADLTRAAEVVSRGLDEIRGATAPRLLLELICARVLLPGADHTTAGVQARLDRIERRLTIAAEHTGQQPEPNARTEPAVAAAASPTPATATAEVMTLVDVRRMWPDVMDAVMRRRRFAWMLLSQNASVQALEDKTLTIALVNAGARESFVRNGCDEILRQSLIDVLGVDWQVEVIVDPSSATSPARRAGAPSEPAPRVATAAQQAPASVRESIRPTRGQGAAARADSSPDDSDASPDDPVLEDGGGSRDELLARELGAEVIEEIRHGS